jgi:uncharacterized protein DUF4350
MKPAPSDLLSAAPGTSGAPPSRGAIVAVVALVCAAWTLSGGCGLLGRPLAGGLTWCALAVIGLALAPKRGSDLRTWGMFGLGLLVPVLTTASSSEVVRLAGLAVCAATLSTLDRRSSCQRTLRIAAQAVAVLALYRFALTSIPFVWHASETLASTLGNCSSAFWGRPLSVGATFAGLDHLVVMAVLIVGWALELERPRWRPVLLAVSAVAIGQTLYLLCLSLALDLASTLPIAPVETPPDIYVPPDWFWGNALRAWLPWNVPVVAVVWQAVVISVMFGLGRYRAETPTDHSDPRRPAAWQTWAPVAVAALLPVVSVLSLGKSDLSDKTILAFDQGYLDWDVPAHDRYGADSSGRFGMLPVFVESLGGQLQRSTELTEEELSTADVLLLIHPNQPWPDELVARIHDYVRQGGSLLVAAGPRLQDATSASSHNDLLESLGMPVRFDTAVSQNEAWRHGMQTGHPAALGLGDDRDRFGMGAAATVQLPWNASPVLVGRWGWSDPGSDFFLSGIARWDAGERLGDLVLAAERRFGAGRVVVLGDNACLTNQGNVRAYRFTGRLLSYLAGRAGSPQVWWRQLAALALAGALVFFWLRPIRGEVLAASGLAFLLSSAAMAPVTCQSWEVYPDGRISTPDNLAYIDASHLEAYAESPWKPDGVDGLALTLMRNGFLVLAADDLSEARLNRAEMLVSIAPARRFTATEGKRVQQFVEGGGVFICMAGAMHGRTANEVLASFGMRVPYWFHRASNEREDAIPLGWLRRPYPDDDSGSAVFFHAAWPVSILGADFAVIPLVLGEDQGQRTGQPIVACAGAGNGVAVVIGDSCFAMNETLEDQEGRTLAGDRGNAHFWRWLIGELPGREPWEPPPFNWSNVPTSSFPSPSASEEPQP